DSSTGSANLRFLVTGTNLRLFVNNILVANLLDTSLSTGSAGIRADRFATLDDFHVAAVTTELPFTDDFNQADNTALNVHWTRRAGNIKSVGDQAAGTRAAPDVNLATLVGLKPPNVEVQADVALTTTNDEVGLVACYRGTGDTDYYMARVLKTAVGFNLSIVKNLGGTVTTLKSRNVAALTGPIRFRLEGPNLKLF